MVWLATIEGAGAQKRNAEFGSSQVILHRVGPTGLQSLAGKVEVTKITRFFFVAFVGAHKFHIDAGRNCELYIEKAVPNFMWL